MDIGRIGAQHGSDGGANAQIVWTPVFKYYALGREFVPTTVREGVRFEAISNRFHPMPFSGQTPDLPPWHCGDMYTQQPL